MKRKKKKPKLRQLELTFDAELSEKEKELMMARAREKRRELLEIARWVARRIAMARPDRCASADDVQFQLINMGYEPEQLGNAAGSIFKGKDWRWTGERVKSVRVSNHGTERRVWEYLGNGGQE